MSDITIGFIGTGRIARLMMDAFSHVDGARVAAIASADQGRADTFAATFHLPKAYGDPEDLLADPEIDAVYVANLNHLHADASIAALQAGKHVLCEKPFAITPEEGERVIAAARASGKLFMEGLWTHLLPASRHIEALLAEKAFGPVVSLYSDFGNPISPDVSSRLYAPVGGGAILDLGIYPATFALKTLGPVASITGAVRRNEDGVDMHAEAHLTHENGATSMIATSMIAMLSNRSAVACEAGRICGVSPVMGLERIEAERFWSASAEERGGFASAIKNRLRSTAALRDLKSRVAGGDFFAYGRNRYTPQGQHFVDAIRAGKTESDIVTHSHSLDVLGLLARWAALQASDAMRVGYLLNTYPMTSTTFVNREIHALERRGVDVKRYAVREWETPLVDDGDKAERDITHYILTGNAPNLIIAFLMEIVTNPIGVVRVLGPWFSLLREARGGLLRHVAYLMQAAYMRRRAARDGLAHIHAHFGANAAAVAMLTRVLGGPSYSFTVHGPDELRESVLLNYPLKIKHAAFVAAISHFCRSQLILFSNGLYGDKIKIVHCGLALDDFTSTPTPDNQHFVCVGRLCPQKGQTMIPAAVAALAPAFPKLHVHLVGDGDSRAAIEKEIAALGVKDRITLHGWMENESVRAMIANARALLLPSAAEGLPVVIMEALALGRPAISTYIAGIPELLDADCGWIIPASSEEALIAAMRDALEVGPEILNAMGAEGRARVAAQHDADKEAATLLTHMRAAIGATGAVS